MEEVARGGRWSRGAWLTAIVGALGICLLLLVVVSARQPPPPAQSTAPAEQQTAPMEQPAQPAEQPAPPPEPAAEQMYLLSAEEASRFPVNPAFANQAVTGTMFDPESGAMLASFGAVNRLRQATSGLDYSSPAGRDKLVEAFVSVFGEEAGRKIGLHLHNAEGHVYYIWPSPQPPAE